MAILFIIAGFFAKVLALLPKGVIEGFLGYLNTRQSEDTKRQGIWATALTAALDVEVQKARTASEERVALWHDPWYRALIWLIVGPPAVHAALIFLDTSLTFVHWGIPPAPPPFDTWGLSILVTFIGGSSGAAAVIGAAKQFNKK